MMLNIPDDLAEQLNALADEQQRSLEDLLREFIARDRIAPIHTE